MQPVIKPLAIAIPYLEPRATDCVRTKMLSGPGLIARSKVASANEVRDSNKSEKYFIKIKFRVIKKGCQINDSLKNIFTRKENLNLCSSLC
jgi:hypothetical protein